MTDFQTNQNLIHNFNHVLKRESKRCVKKTQKTNTQLLRIF